MINQGESYNDSSGCWAGREEFLSYDEGGTPEGNQEQGLRTGVLKQEEYGREEAHGRVRETHEVIPESSLEDDSGFLVGFFISSHPSTERMNNLRLSISRQAFETSKPKHESRI